MPKINNIDWKSQVNGLEELCRRKRHALLCKKRVIEVLADLFEAFQSWETNLSVYEKKAKIFGLEVEDLRACDTKDIYGIHALQEVLSPWKNFIRGKDDSKDIDREAPV